MSIPHAIEGSVAGAITRSLDAYVQKTGGKASRRGSYTRYKNLPHEVDGLAQDLENAIAQDKAEAETFWNDLKAIWKNNINYFAEQARFNREVRELITNARRAMLEIRRLTAEPIRRLAIPDELYDVADQWFDVHDRTTQVQGRMPPLKETGEWGGPSAGTYHTMTDVQISATSEYVNMPWNLLLAYENAGDYNKTVLSTVYSRVVAARRAASARDQTPGDGEFYVRTANMFTSIASCARALPTDTNMTVEAATELASDIAKAHQSAIIIREGWPTGTAMAGREAGDTRVGGGRAHIPQYDPTPTNTEPVEGVERWGDD